MEGEVTMRDYWIEFENWSIEADNPEDAMKKALEQIEDGAQPAIINVEVQD